MAIYYILLAAILGLGFLLCERFPSKRNKIIYLAVVFGFMWVMATFRKNIGYDYQSYINIFEEIRGAHSWEALKGINYEIGFVLLTKLMTLFITSPVVMYGVYSALILVPIAIFIYRHSDSVWLSSWLYVTIALFYTNMNFIRQSLACSVCALAFGFFVSKERFEIDLKIKSEKTGENLILRPYKYFIPFIIMALIAVSFHKTAIIIIPIYFFSHIKLNKVTSIIYAVAVVVIYASSNYIIDYIIKNTKYSYYEDSIYINAYLGGEFLLVPFTVLILCIAVYWWWKDIDPRAQVLLNVAIVNATIWIFGATKHMIVERFSMYSYVYTLVIVPSALRALLAKPSDIREYNEISADVARRGNVPKSVNAKLGQLEMNISDHKKYYWSATVAILLITFIYNYFGMYINKFHAVFPYQSIFG